MSKSAQVFGGDVPFLQPVQKSDGAITIPITKLSTEHGFPR